MDDICECQCRCFVIGGFNCEIVFKTDWLLDHFGTFKK